MDRTTNASDYEWAILYGGKYWDAENGFIQNRYRYLNPFTGRWLSRDPVGEEGALNLYEFVINNGINAIDKLGLQIFLSPQFSPRPVGRGFLPRVDGRVVDEFGRFPGGGVSGQFSPRASNVRPTQTQAVPKLRPPVPVSPSPPQTTSPEPTTGVEQSTDTKREVKDSTTGCCYRWTDNKSTANWRKYERHVSRGLGLHVLVIPRVGEAVEFDGGFIENTRPTVVYEAKFGYEFMARPEDQILEVHGWRIPYERAKDQLPRQHEVAAECNVRYEIHVSTELGTTGFKEKFPKLEKHIEHNEWTL